MPGRIDRKIARRAVDAWFRRLLHRARYRRRDGEDGAAVDRAVERAQRHTREALVDAVVDADLSADLCRDAGSGKAELARRLRERSEVVAPQIAALEQVVASSPAVQRIYRPLIDHARALLDPRSAVPAQLLQEICLVVSLSRRDRVPWARRR